MATRGPNPFRASHAYDSIARIPSGPIAGDRHSFAGERLDRIAPERFDE